MNYEIELSGFEKSFSSISVKNLPKLKEKQGIPFVYFLIHENDIVYIGVSESVYNRFLQHKCNKYYEPQKIFDSALLLQYKNLAVDKAMEKIFISKIKTKYNIMVSKSGWITVDKLAAYNTGDQRFL